MKKIVRIVNTHEAKTKAGKPLVKVVPVYAPPPRKVQRLGFMSGQMAIPEDFDTMGSTEIAQIFEGKG